MLKTASGWISPGLALAAVLACAPAFGQAEPEGAAPQISESTADHSKFEALKGPFASGPEVSAACLSCHTEAGDQVRHSIHWSWEFEHPETGQSLGKSQVVNSFCGTVASNEPRCTSCHVGYGWDDMGSPPPQAANAVDCLVCHDNSGQYTKLATGAGHPPLEAKGKTITGANAWAVDLAEAAQSVGAPGRENCGSCHFYGGGGDNVKHGDLSSALYDPPLAVDVHMSAEGQDFTCSTCHVSDKHVFAGSRYNVLAADHAGMSMPGTRRDVATCESCHGSAPHEMLSLTGMKLNDHVDRVACQTCHIPEFARGGVATKTRWDWSTAGRMDANGKPMSVDGYTQGDGKELHTYLATKGDFEYGEDVVPHYAWFDGQVEYTLADEKIDPGQVVEVNKISGDPASPDSRIWPFKRMEGRQAYDAGLNHLVYTNVWGPETDTAYWTNFDWAKAIEAGMSAAGREYSGEFGFVDTYMYWPITHMVAPAEGALECQSCHAEGGRLANMAGFYMPGANPRSWGGLLGMAVLAAMALGVAGHLGIRLVANARRKGGENG